MDEYILVKDQLPEKGKNVIGVEEDGSAYECYRCSCPIQNCKTWKCSLTGYALIIDVVKWRYK